MKTIYRILIVSLAIIFTYVSYILICKKIIYPIKYDEYVLKAAKEHNIDPYLIFAIIKQESNFNKNATSRKNAKGLMQVLDSTASDIAKTIYWMDIENIDLYDASTNITIGVKYFKTLLDRYGGNISLAICAYNAGLGNVDKWISSEEIFKDDHINISNIPFKETKTYLTNILKYYNRYVKLYE